MARQDYRSTHQTPEHGKGYDERYGAGFKRFFWTELEAPVLRSVLERLKGERDIQRVLDFACGTGRILEVLEPLFPASTGVDISEQMLARAFERCPRSTLVCADVTREGVDLGPEFGPFDLACAFRFFLKAEDDLRASALEFLSRHISPGGFLVANTHNQPYSPHGLRSALLEKALGSKKQEPRLSWSELVALAEPYGFEHVEHHPLGFLPGVRNRPPLPRGAYKALDRAVARSPFGDTLCQNAIVVMRRK